MSSTWGLMDLGDQQPVPVRRHQKTSELALDQMLDTWLDIQHEPLLGRRKEEDAEGAADRTERELCSRNMASQARFLNAEQREIFKLVVEDECNLFFTGPAGTGKSSLLASLIRSCRFRHGHSLVEVTAPTGLAALKIMGVTIHSFAGIGIKKATDADFLIREMSMEAKQRWSRVRVLIIDEISMVDAVMFDMLEHIARKIRGSTAPFGGIQVVITGDFFQLLPVAEEGEAAKFAFEATKWAACITHTALLTQVFRQKDPALARFMNELRIGRLTPQTIATFRELRRPLPESIDGEMATTQLFATRAQAEEANMQLLEQLPGESISFPAADDHMEDKALRDKLLSKCGAPATVTLKRGAKVMLTRNHDTLMVNGLLGTVISFQTEAFYNKIDLSPEHWDKDCPTGDGHAVRYPVVLFEMPGKYYIIMLVQQKTWTVDGPDGEVERVQIPLILAWALTMHKAQGQTLPRVVVDLSKVTQAGQAYTACSRATSMAGLQILNFPGRVRVDQRVIDFNKKLEESHRRGTRSVRSHGDVNMGDALRGV